MLLRNFILILWSIASLLLVSCEREYVFRGNGTEIRFSTDTVAFDTIFTSVGSITQNLRVSNPVQDDVVVEAIELMGGEDSDFVLNVNGNAGSRIEDVSIRGNDSVVVFIEAHIKDSGDKNTPFVVSDSIMFYTRDKIQKVHLVAYGQDVIPLRKENLKTQSFTNDKPYLIYDWVVVDSAETLTIDPGTRLHFHKDAFFIVFGTVQVNGESDNPVLFTTDRMDEWYADKPGQWGYIHLMPGSENHTFNNAVIRNSTMGIVVDSVGIEPDAEPLQLNNVKIEHVTAQGLLAQNSSIIASNSVFADCGSASVALTVGGSYKFYHCTIANYFTWAFRSTPALLISNYFTDVDNQDRFSPVQTADFHNCIIYGIKENEIKLDFIQNPDDEEDVPVFLNVNFSHSLLKIEDEKKEAYSEVFNNGILFNEDPDFADVSKYNYELDTLSAGLEAGDYEIAREYPFDFYNTNRVENNKLPDLGAIERVGE